MRSILVINHGTPLVGELRDYFDNLKHPSLVSDYKDLARLSASDFYAIFSIGGSTPNPGGKEIEGNSDLGEEIRIWEECERGVSRMMGIAHGAQIGAHQSGGELVEIAARNGYNFDDYVRKNDDPLIDGVVVPELRMLEWHGVGIKSVGPEYKPIIRDGLDMIQIARHENSSVYIVQGNPFARRPKEGTQVTNSEILIANFLK